MTRQKNIETSFPLITTENILKARIRLKDVVVHTPLLHNLSLSEEYDANLFLKREDLQIVRSYKIRGAYNKMISMSAEELANGVVCASAGNHAQGVALACQKMEIRGQIFMPSTTPPQKIKKVKAFGKSFIEIVLEGDTFDASYQQAIHFAEQENRVFVHPFNDEKVIEGQATIGMEILEDARVPIDYLFVAIGGGGLASGLGAYFSQMSPETKIIGVEPSGAAAMYESRKAGKLVKLKNIDPFVDGAAVQKVGEKTFALCEKYIEDIIRVPEGKVCTTILALYNDEAIVAEPAGALTIAALDFYKEQIKGKNVVCIVSGGNNDIIRTEEIKERSMLYEGLKHYFIIKFPQRAGALREFLNEVLGENDDIAHFEYTKKHNRESGPAMVGIEVKRKSDYQALLKRMNDHQIDYQIINESKLLFGFLV